MTSLLAKNNKTSGEPTTLLATQPRPNLGHRADPQGLSSEEIQAHCEAVQEARRRACRQLRNAIQRRKASSRASRATPSTRQWLESSRTNRSSDIPDSEVPAIFPFPEPIPREVPSRTMRASTPVQYGGSSSSRASSRAGAYAAGHSSPVPARSTPSPGPLPCRLSAGPPEVPAVFPFPEPIPHCVPSGRLLRPRSTSPRGEQLEPNVDTDLTGTSMRRGDEDWLNEGAKRKLKVSEQAFLHEQRQTANRWITETTPHGVILPRNKRQVWVVTRNDDRERRRIHNTTIRQMPSLPFDLWLQMKDEEMKNAQEETPTDQAARRSFYITLAAQRKRSSTRGSVVSSSKHMAARRLSCTSTNEDR